MPFNTDDDRKRMQSEQERKKREKTGNKEAAPPDGPRPYEPPAARPGSALRYRPGSGSNMPGPGSPAPQPRRSTTPQPPSPRKDGRPGAAGDPAPQRRPYGYQGSGDNGPQPQRRGPDNNVPPVINGQPYQAQGQQPNNFAPPQNFAPPRLNDDGYGPQPARGGGPRRPQNQAIPARRPQPRPRIRIGVIIGWLLLALVAIAGLIGLYVFTRGYALLNGISTQRVDNAGNAISADSNILGRDSINILLLGLDTRPGAPDGTRSDTMIVVTINPKTKAAAMLSMPRDMWVAIPGHGSNRINAAYFFGDQAKPGVGGPILAKQTVTQDFNIPIDYYAQVDFTGFQAVVDAIGGVTIDVQKPLIDNEFPTPDYGLKRLYIPAGLQHMNGQTALEYARSRHADSDLGRNQRQQQVLIAIREGATNFGILGKLDQLSTALQGAIQTDLSPGELVALAQLAGGMNKNGIHQFAIDANMTKNANIDGNAVLVPDMTAVKQLVDQFKSSTK